MLQKTGFDFHRHRSEPNKLAWLEKAQIRTVIDVGANTGQFVKEIRSVLPDAFVYSFEPLRDCYGALVEERKDDRKFKAFHFALGDSHEETVMHRNNYSPSSSLLPMGELHKTLYPHTKDTSTEKIIVRRLDDMNELDPANLEKEILVKIDTQGYEDRVIRGGTRFLKHTKAMIVETSFTTLYEGQLLFADIYAMLAALGFGYRGGIHQKFDPKSGKLIFEDSLFVR